METLSGDGAGASQYSPRRASHGTSWSVTPQSPEMADYGSCRRRAQAVFTPYVAGTLYFIGYFEDSRARVGLRRIL